MSENKYKFNNGFLISCIVCIIVILVLCYFTFSSSFLSSLVIKGTSAAESCVCGEGEELITGNLCKKDSTSDLGDPWDCEELSGGVFSCTKEASCTTVPNDDEYACFYGPGEGQYWKKYGDYKSNSDYQYIANVKREDCKDEGNVCGVDEKYGTWNESSCTNAGHTWDSSNSCCVCGAGYYVNSSSVCTKCEAGYYCTGNRERLQCESGKTSLEGATKESDCTSDKVSVTYNANGGSGTMGSSECIKSKSCTIKKNTFTKSGYSFDGWTGNDNKTYTDGQTITISSDLTLTAKWKKNNNGSSSPSSSSSSSSSVSSSSSPSSSSSSVSSSPSSSLSPSSSSGNEVNDNPQTGEIAIFGVWVIALGAICYSFWYFRKANEN